MLPPASAAVHRRNARFVESHCNSSRPSSTSSQSGPMPAPADPHSVAVQDEPGKTMKEENMRKRLVIGVAVVVVAIGAGFAIKSGQGASAVPASAAMAANAPDVA